VDPPPAFFVSVDSEGFRLVVSCLESTLAGLFVSVASKRVRVVGARTRVYGKKSIGEDFDVLVVVGRVGFFTLRLAHSQEWLCHKFALGSADSQRWLSHKEVIIG
jgi:hypothetical protein